MADVAVKGDIIKLVNIHPSISERHGIKDGDLFEVLGVQNDCAEIMLSSQQEALVIKSRYRVVTSVLINYIREDKNND